ncbi:ESX secretion-associated protein EspG [Gandjariella thermophila]|uniref:ESX secretion-associated protein EspG n=1 Tax=Gandjariella thermophila TaxID=1931992 RepID=A0A4D4J5B5_9PSEU|nr:ESX secretion-associated protein EspG [Gandjariella thermophila]GDY30654.1 ESX secretion-associated protein EspG [Gandjariella thermophila]
MAWAGRVELPLEVFTAIWRWEDIGEPHNVLADAITWQTEDEQRAADRRAWAVLAERGLAGPRGLDPEFGDLVRLIDRPEVEFYGWITAPQVDISVLVSVGRRDAGLVVRDKPAGVVRVHRIYADGAMDALLAQLPPVPAARGASVSVPEADMREQPGPRVRPLNERTGFTSLAAVQREQDAAVRPEVSALKEILNLPRTGGGQLYAARWTPMGVRKRIERPVVYLDTASGRWLTQLRRSPSGESWIVAAPATPQLLASRLHEALRMLS